MPILLRRFTDVGYRARGTQRGGTMLRATAAILALGMMVLPKQARAQTAADTVAIRQAALDYIEGYYEGNGERMERALHPELAKRIVRTDDKGRSSFSNMSALTLINGTKMGGG